MNIQNSLRIVVLENSRRHLGVNIILKKRKEELVKQIANSCEENTTVPLGQYGFTMRVLLRIRRSRKNKQKHS